MAMERMDPDAAERKLLRGMRKASILEGITLLALLLIAMPLKYLAGYSVATAIMGPIHGAAFLIFIWMLVQSQTTKGWSSGDRLRLLIAAFIPFGAIMSGRALKRKEDMLFAL